MEDVSNKTIVALLAIALVVTVVGTIVSVSKLGDMGGKYAILSGAATTGTTSLTVAGSAGISVVGNTANFGTGYVAAGQTSGTACTYLDGICSLSSWTNTTALDDPAITVENTGTIDINLTVSSDANTAESWLAGGTDTAVAELSVLSSIAGAIGGEVACDDFNISGTFANSTYQQILTNTGKNTVTLCDDMDFIGSADILAFTFKAIVPYDSTVGAKSTTLTFTGTSIGTQN